MDVLCSNPLQERQRLETILCLCSEFGRSDLSRLETDSGVSAVSDLQKINRELEKLQVSDDESVFSDSAGASVESGFVGKSRGEILTQRHRRLSGHRETRPQSPTTSLRSSAPSPSPHLRSKVRLYVGSDLPLLMSNTENNLLKLNSTRKCA